MKISEEKRKKISEQILSFLYSYAQRPLFTSIIAKEIARDEEFVKKLLLELKNKKLVVEVKKNPKGKTYKRRSRWKLSDETYSAYRRLDNQNRNI